MNVAESPYVFERSSGLMHVRSRKTRECLGHTELAVAEILMHEARRAALAEAREVVERAVLR